MPLPCFFLEATVLHLIFWSMIYFEEMNLMKSVRSVSELRALFDCCFIAACVYHLSQNHLVERTIFTSFIAFVPWPTIE